MRRQIGEGCIHQAPQARSLALKLECATEQMQAHARTPRPWPLRNVREALAEPR
jgi:hypothetical protein